MQVNITQFNVQLYFKKPLLDTERLNDIFSVSNGFSANPVAQDYGRHPMQKTASFSREGFRIAPVQSNVLPFRILQVISVPNFLEDADAETLECLKFVVAGLQQHLNINVENDIYAVRVVSHFIVNGRPDVHYMLSKLTTIANIPSLAGRFVAHKNPMNAIQLVTRTGSEVSHSNWSDIRVSQFRESSYVVTIFNETDSLSTALHSIAGVKQFVANLMQEMEQVSR